LIDVDPRCLHAFWSLPKRLMDDARGALGARGADVPLVLRVTTEGEARTSAFDVQVQGLQGQTYVEIWDAPRRYRAELGLRRPDGRLLGLIQSNVAQLPPLGPADEAANLKAMARRAEAEQADRAPPAMATPEPIAVALGTAEVAEPAEPGPAPLRLSFPPPPIEAGPFDPALPVAGAEPPPLPASGPKAAEATAPPETGTEAVSAEAPPPLVQPASPPEAAAETGPLATPAFFPFAGPFGALPEPVAEPFPPPPSEAGEFDLRLLVAAPPPPPGQAQGAAADQAPMQAPAEGAPPIGSLEGVPAAAPEAIPEGEAAGMPSGEHAWQPAPTGQADAGSGGTAEAPAGGSDEPAPLALESTLSLSSFALGRETVELEVSAELHIFGRAKPGTDLHLFGRKVALRPDGSFSISRPLPNGALVISALFAGNGTTE
jgi:hypothetical protein